MPIQSGRAVMGRHSRARTERSVAERWSDMTEYQERLRSLALSDDRFVGAVLGMGQDTVEISRLDAKTHALVRLAALLAVDASQSSYNASVESALATGASSDEIVGILI